MLLKENKLDRGIRLFENPLLDLLSRVHPALPALVWGPLAVVMILWATGPGGVSWITAAWLLPVGWVVWLFGEYALHRGPFHFQPKALWLRRWFYYVHEHHHRYQERDRLMAPLLMSVPIFLGFVGVFYLLVALPLGGRTGEMWLLLAGTIFGYLAYDYVHFYTHFAKPRTRIGRYVRRCHMQHHFARPDKWYCISFPWLDFLFGTALSRGEKSVNHREYPGDLEDHMYAEEDLPPMVQAYEAAHGGPLKQSTASPAEPRKAAFG